MRRNDLDSLDVVCLPRNKSKFDFQDDSFHIQKMFDIYEFCGYSAGIFFAGSLVPQVHKSYVTKDMDDISYGWQILLIIALLMSLVYSIHMNLPPVYISTFLELIFMIILVIMKIMYKDYNTLDKIDDTSDIEIIIEEP